MPDDASETAENVDSEIENMTSENDDDPEIPDSTDASVEIASNSHFNSLIEVHDRVLAFVYAEWCDICEAMEPIIEDLAARDDTVVASINIEANEPLAKSLGVMELPTFVLFVKGTPVQKEKGAHEREWFNEFLQPAD